MPRPAWKTAQESWPRQGNRELPILLDFTSTTTIVDDISPEMQASSIESIQAIYVDNSANAAPFSITFQPSGQNITVQAFTQGVFPVICWGLLRYTAVTTQGQRIPIIFTNTRKDFFSWGPAPGVTVVPALTNIPLNFQPLAVGDNVLIPAVALQTIKVYRMMITFGGGANVRFFSGASPTTPLTGIMNMFAGGSITLQPSGIPWWTTLVGQGLIMNSDAGVNMGGMIGYVQS